MGIEDVGLGPRVKEVLPTSTMMTARGCDEEVVVAARRGQHGLEEGRSPRVGGCRHRQ